MRTCVGCGGALSGRSRAIWVIGPDLRVRGVAHARCQRAAGMAWQLHVDQVPDALAARFQVFILSSYAQRFPAGRRRRLERRTMGALALAEWDALFLAIGEPTLTAWGPAHEARLQRWAELGYVPDERHCLRVRQTFLHLLREFRALARAGAHEEVPT